MEQRRIEGSLGVILWQELGDEIEREYRGVNSLAGHRIVVERSQLNIAVTDINTRKSPRLSYQETAPLVSYRETGKRDANIAFDVEQASVPSLSLMYRGIPLWRQALAEHLMIELTRF